MSKSLRVLIVEDSENDATLIIRELRHGGYDVTYEQVETPSAMEAALNGNTWDVIIADYNIPGFGALASLSLMQKKGLELPFIIISGSIGEDIAVEAVKAGATDYLMKDKLARFVPAIERGLREVEEKRLRKQAETDLKLTSEQLSLLLGSMPIIPYIAGTEKGDSGITFIGDAVTEITGYKPEDFTSHSAFWADHLHPEDGPKVFEKFQKLSEKHIEEQEHEYRWRVADGTYRWFNDLFRLVTLPDGTTHIIGALHDVTARKQAEEELRTLNESLEHRVAERTEALVKTNEDLRTEIIERKRAEETVKYMAYHDALTSLPNRALFVDHLTLELAHAKRDKVLLAVLFLDLDRFKDVNDKLGHTAGDQLLKEVARRLKMCVRESDTVSRLGGDEFTVLLPGINKRESATGVADKILEAVRQPMELDGHEVSITTSIGIVLYPNDCKDPDTLLKNADAAMYRAKEMGRNNYQVHTPS